MGLLINKIIDPYFDGIDEEMALAFSIYCGVCIIHAVGYQKIQEAHVRNALATELVLYHMKVCEVPFSSHQSLPSNQGRSGHMVQVAFTSRAPGCEATGLAASQLF